MQKTNWRGVILGGLLWWVVFHAVGAAAWYLVLRDPWTAQLAALGRPSMETPAFIACYLATTFVAAIIAVWFYAALRPRYGPGPATAMKTGVALWLFGLALPTVTWGVLLAFPTGLIATDLTCSLISVLAASLAGGWAYRDA
jgi:hypothetical protein